MKIVGRSMSCAGLALLLAGSAVAGIKTWQAGSGNWNDGANWAGGVPGAGDDVFITNASANVLLAASTPALTSLTLSGKLVCTNWGTALQAQSVTVATGGLITLPNAFSETQMSNRVWIVCSNLTVQVKGSIDATGQGYAGSPRGTAGYGPGQGLGIKYGGGGGYGGAGGCGTVAGGSVYGDVADPLLPGSGGGAYTDSQCRGGAGGGAVRIEAAGDVLIAGTIAANGIDAIHYSGGGSGGAVAIHCHRFGGDGRITANGGKHANAGGGGGGGRIAVNYDSLIGTPAIRLEAREGTSPWPMWGPDLRWSQYRWCAAPGTLYFSDTEILGQVVTNLYGEIHIPDFASWAPTALTVNNALLRFNPGFDLRVTGELVVGPNGALELMSDSYLQVGNDLRLDGGRLVMNVFTQANFLANLDVSQGGLFYAFSGPTNGIEAAGACVNVAGDIHIGKSSWIIPEANGTNGGPVRFRARNVQIAADGGFNADGRGFLGAWFDVSKAGYGPGGAYDGQHGAGGGYGGRGGDNVGGTWMGIGGSSYGVSNAFLQAGSGGGNWNQATGGHGGGLVWIEAMETVHLDGVLSADGGAAGAWSGGGSGGGVFIMTPRLSGGAAAVLRANGSGGVNDGGPGGGGRIVVAVDFDDAARKALVDGTPVAGLHAYTHHAGYEGAMVTAAGTTGANYTGQEARAPQPGTCVFLTTNPTIFVTGTPGNFGHPAPYDYGTCPYYAAGTWITNSVVTPADEAHGLRHACLGWTLEDANGNFVAADTTQEVVFLLNAPHVLTWKWTNEYYLAVQEGPDGSVTTAQNGWYTNPTVIDNIAATPNNGYVFDRWVGDFPAGGEQTNPLTVTMDRPRTLAPVFISTAGLDKNWIGGVGRWEDSGNWAPAGMPGRYDRVAITSGTATINLPRQATSVTIGDKGTLIFTNWVASLTASNVTIAAGGLVTLPPAFTDDGMSNRVWMICTNLTVQSGGSINATGKGYAGGYNGSAGYGPGKGFGGGHGGGAGYGGLGGCSDQRLGGPIYADPADPIFPGSGGGTHPHTSARGGAGGGAVRVEAHGDVIIDGIIAVNGTDASYHSGGGSGGAVAIHCHRFGGDGSITANAGKRANTGGGGGGGRIAVIYDSLMGTPNIRIEAREADSQWPMWDTNLRWSQYRWSAQPGSIYLSDTALLGPVITRLYGQLSIPDIAAWRPAALTISNALIRLEPGVDLQVAGNLTVGPSGALELQDNACLSCGGELTLDGGRLVMNVFTQLTGQAGLTLTNGGRLLGFSGPTNGTEAAGACVDVARDIHIGKSSWIIPDANGTNGGPVRVRARNVQIAADGGFNADGRGFLGAWYDAVRTGYGPGGASYGNHGAGGGYGGRGGDCGNWVAIGGISYGVSNAMPQAGSGGSNWNGDTAGHGGGLVWIEATGGVRLDGLLSANGGLSGSYSGGGSGGGIFVVTPRFSGGTSAALLANGGNGANDGGPGGGGRIVVAVGLTAAERDRLYAGQAGNLRIGTSHVLYTGGLEAKAGVLGADYTSAPERAPQVGSALFLKSAGGLVLLVR